MARSQKRRQAYRGMLTTRKHKLRNGTNTLKMTSISQEFDRMPFSFGNAIYKLVECLGSQLLSSWSHSFSNIRRDACGCLYVQFTFDGWLVVESTLLRRLTLQLELNELKTW